MSVAAVLVAAAGAAILAASVAGARRPDISPAEQKVFRAVNGLPDWLYRPMWVPMQFGNLVVGSSAGLLVAAWYGSWTTAASVVAATLLKLVTERWLRSRLRGFAAARQRPGTSEPGAVLRGDVPATGASFPSGHVILAAAVSCVVAGHLPSISVWVPVVLTLGVLVGRVYVGAHNPLDVTAGLGAGLVVGGLLTLLP